jgi:hypothetical protein
LTTDNRRDPKTGVQDTARLVQECAYEHWHRMLFARFLAETDLLIEPHSGVAITLDEVQELAREKATDWLELASDYAERMLPQIFRKDDPVLDIALPPETRSEMEDLLKGLTRPVFEADDSLGWVYQFWQSDKKDEVNKSEVKIGADELPAVTQLFTEDYMVLFLLHNTLGAWWAGKVLADNAGLAASALDEATLRAACKVGDIDWTYLRFVRDKADNGAEGLWRPAAGLFEGWPKAAKDLTVLDPCMGSGHFLVFALPILVAFRMDEEGLSQSAAVDAVLKDNLFGLEIDPRCTQIAAFNLAFAAWRKVGHRPLPQLNLACSGLAIGVTKAEWLKLAEKAVTAADPAAKRDLLGVEKNLLTVGLEERVKNGLEALYDLFAKAPWLGSLIDPRRASGDIFREGFDKLEPLLASILSAADTDDAREMAVAAQGMAKTAELLSARYSLVCTNVPYLKRGQQDDTLRSHADKYYSAFKGDLATIFQARIHESMGIVSAVVSPQSWLFQPSYRETRRQLLDQVDFGLVFWLGAGAFETITGEVVKPCLLVCVDKAAQPLPLCYLMDLSESELSQKAERLALTAMSVAPNERFARHPENIVSLSEHSPNTAILELRAKSHKGITTNDDPTFIFRFWELPTISSRWDFHQTTVSQPTEFGGMSNIILFEEGRGRLRALAASLIPDRHQDKRGINVWGRRGVAISCTGLLPPSHYIGTKFDTNVAVISVKDESDLPALVAFTWSTKFSEEVRKIDRSLKVTNATLTKVPFDLPYWRSVASERFPSGLPKPISDDPTQWIFVGHPAGSKQPLQVGFARLLSYQWPRQTGSSFLECANVQPDNVVPYADEDGIVCITALKGEPPAAERLNGLLSEAFCKEWSAAKLAGLLAEVGYSGKSLDDWLRDGFFAQHCELFHQRPFIWHIWDGRRDGFHALVNYHRLAASQGEGRRTLEKLIYSYLGDWIDRQRAEQTAGVEGADVRLAHAEHLKAELIKILEGEPPYDIFVRWKPLHEQPVGWDPDINDGVRINIRPFMTARTLNARGTNTCILRATPKIKWDKDRGKEPTRDKAEYPWFWSCDEATTDFAGGATCPTSAPMVSVVK